MKETPVMRALVVVESWFGNTAQIAEAIADGLREAGADVEVTPAASAPREPVADLIVVAAPTHNLGLPSPASRGKAIEGGGSGEDVGIREWLEQATPSAARLTCVDTVVASMFSGSAAKAAQKLAHRRGWHADRGPSFLVGGTKGPLAADALETATALGRSLGS
jgi:methylmalonyl-CoA mutase cobalamin-binding subunit